MSEEIVPIQRSITKTRIVRGRTIKVHVIDYGGLSSLPVEINHSIDSLGYIHCGYTLIGAVHVEV